MGTFQGTGIKNLKLRDNVYYWRQKIAGVQYSESLQTGDRDEALKRMTEKIASVSDRVAQKEKKGMKQQTSGADWLEYWPQLKVLDCTIRDGGLMNNHQFSDDFVKAVYRAVVDAGVDYMEIGYKADRKLYSPTEFGPWKSCSEEDIRRIIGDEEKGTKISVMADVGRTNEKDIVHKDQSVIDMVRVACYIHQIPAALDLIRDAKDKGYETSVNLMAVSTIPELELNKGLELIGRSEADMVYIVDSYGALYFEQIDELLKRYLAAVGPQKQVGIHAHNNLQMAYANTVYAAIHGATMLDTTICGLGRGAGNCPTELLLGFLRNPKFHQRPIIECVEKLMLPLQQKIDWGYSIPYMITGQKNEHPRSAMAVREGDKKNEFLKFYDEIFG